MATANVDRPKSFVKRHYILLKIHYFLSHASLASFSPVVDMILDQRGLTFLEISYINLLIPFVVFFTNPLFGYIADHTRRFRITFNTIFGIGSVLLLTMFFLPSIKTNDIRGELHANETMEHSLIFCANEEFARKCTLRNKCGCIYQAKCISLTKQRNVFHFNFTMTEENIKEQSENLEDENEKHSICEINYRIAIDQVDSFKNLLKPLSKKRSKLANCEIKCSSKHICYGSRYSNEIRHVLLYGVLAVLGRSLFHNAMTIGTSIGFALINRSNLFGRQRVWGAIGSGLTAFLASRIYAHYKTDYIYISIFIVTSISSIIVTCFVRVHQTGENEQENLNETKKEEPVMNMKALRVLLKKLDVIIFLLTTLIWGMSFGALEPYLLMHIDETSPCHAHSIAGYLTLIAAIFEIIAFLISHRFLGYFRIKISTILIFLAFSIRFFGYYFIHQPYFYLILEITHFFNFGILFVLISEEAFKIAPWKFVGTLQGLVHGISFGLGHGIGLLICLLITRKTKERNLFLVYAIINLIGGLLYFIYCLLSKQKSSPSKKKHPADWKEVKAEAEKDLNEELIL